MRVSKSFDWIILICILLISGFGTVIISSIAPEVLTSQIIFYVFGLGIFFFFSRFDYHVFESIDKLIYVAAIILFGITLFLGLESHGAIRWIPIGPFRLQFSEIFKPLLVVAFASFLISRDASRFRNYALLLVVIGIPILLVFKQPDLGSAVIFAVGFFAMLAASGTTFLYLIISFLALVGVAPLVWKFMADYQKNRILSFLSPHLDPLGTSYNSIQALITVGSGMFFGRGLGRGTQSHLAFLPERHTDFVFASLSEEMGFIGSASLLVIYFVLIWRIFSIASETSSRQGRLICIGIGAMLLTQIFISVGMNIGLVPVTGITLPLVSYGGSSVLSTMMALGIVENIVSSREIN